jgi:hypothetical protein
MSEHEPDSFMKIAYLYLSEGKSESEVGQILKERGADSETASCSIIEAKKLLKELSEYRNMELLKTLLVGVALIVAGLFFSDFAADGPGRARGIANSVKLLGAGVIGYGLWARTQPR